MAIFEEAGLTVRAPQEVRPDLLPPEGVLEGEVSDVARRDAERAAEVLRALGAADVGQACVVAQGRCLAVEALPGTDHMLGVVAGLGSRRPDPGGGRGLVMKAPKPGQDRRVDLPAIGPETIRGAAEAGLGGVVVEAGGVLALDLEDRPAGGPGGGAVPLGPAGLRVFLVAGEASGDALGAALMDGLRALVPGVSFEGVGGPGMEARGLRPLFPMEELSVMGLAEILPRYPALRRRMLETAAAAVASAPDVVVTIDAPAFGLSVTRRVRAARPETRLVHYVAPSVWAWRPGRARRLRGVVDLVLALLPFEPPHLEAAGVPCRFVGHPIAGRPPARPGRRGGLPRGPRHRGGRRSASCPAPAARRSRGWRPCSGRRWGRLAARRPGLRAVVPAAPAVAGLLPGMVAGWPGEPIVVLPNDGARGAAFAACDVAIAASGTVSLDLAHAGVPMVIAYDVHPITRAILGRMLRIDTVTLVNLVSETRAVPEFLGRDCRPAADRRGRPGAPGRTRTAQRAAFALTMERLGAGGEPPGLRAARAVVEAL